MNTSIYVVTHKQFNPPKIKGYYPIEVGADLHTADLGYIKDNTEENISDRNKNYCELTALYWIWKNDRKSDIVGICHYRRYFSKYLFDNNPVYYLTVKDVESTLSNYDMILPAKFFWLKHNVASGYYEAGQGRKKDLLIAKKVIKEKYPQYLNSFMKVLDAREASYCNMMICKKEIFDEYCYWLFDILFEIEKRTDITDYTVAEARIYGYLSEILLNVWVDYKKLRVKYCNVAVNKSLTRKRAPLAKIEKSPIIGYLSRILLCMDLNSL